MTKFKDVDLGLDIKSYLGNFSCHDDDVLKKFFEDMEEILPYIEFPLEIHINECGLWNKRGSLNHLPRLAYSMDECGRLVLFINDDVIFKRYVRNSEISWYDKQHWVRHFMESPNKKLYEWTEFVDKHIDDPEYKKYRYNNGSRASIKSKLSSCLKL